MARKLRSARFTPQKIRAELSSKWLSAGVVARLSSWMLAAYEPHEGRLPRLFGLCPLRVRVACKTSLSGMAAPSSCWTSSSCFLPSRYPAILLFLALGILSVVYVSYVGYLRTSSFWPYGRQLNLLINTSTLKTKFGQTVVTVGTVRRNGLQWFRYSLGSHQRFLRCAFSLPSRSKRLRRPGCLHVGSRYSFWPHFSEALRRPALEGLRIVGPTPQRPRHKKGQDKETVAHALTAPHPVQPYSDTVPHWRNRTL